MDYRDELAASMGVPQDDPDPKAQRAINKAATFGYLYGSRKEHNTMPRKKKVDPAHEEALKQPLETFPDAACEGGVNPFKATTSHEHSPVLRDLQVGHNSHVAHPTKEGYYIGSIVKTPSGYRGRLYKEPVTVDTIKLGNVPLLNHNAVIRNARPKVRFAMLHYWEKNVLGLETSGEKNIAEAT